MRGRGSWFVFFWRYSPRVSISGTADARGVSLERARACATRSKGESRRNGGVRAGRWGAADAERKRCRQKEKNASRPPQPRRPPCRPIMILYRCSLDTPGRSSSNRGPPGTSNWLTVGDGCSLQWLQVLDLLKILTCVLLASPPAC
jgi:hypothetical protein